MNRGALAERPPAAAKRGEPCLIPVVVRDIGDDRMLTIGAQENLQRQDLDPIEEAQIVAWHQRMFSEAV